MPFPWERPLGARPQPGGQQTTFRVWAPKAAHVAVRVRGGDHPLEQEGFGIWAATVPARHGDDYGYVLDGAGPWPDPATRWQPEGLRGPSRVVELDAPTPHDPGDLGQAVIYELHVGTFTEEGTFDAAIEHLPGLAELGVTAVEVMPIAEFPGRHGWGYDGVYLSAAQSSYGGPQAFQRFVEAAHRAGLSVVLDVVYNHVGASGGDALRAFGPYFTDKYETFWGSAINFDDAECDPVREWVLQSAQGWCHDFGVDGLRLDAIHAIFDGSAEPLLREVKTRVGPDRWVISESGRNDPVVMRAPEQGGYGHDAAWADDFHHCLRTLLTEEREGYYEEFGLIADLAKVLHRPHLHDGTYSTFRRKRFGAPADDLPPSAFVVFSQDHDQVGNRALGDRMPVAARPLAAFLTLLSPFVPMLWMGEEHGETAPFQFFSDHIDEEIATATREGRRREFAAFAAFSGQEVPDPQDPETFLRSKLTRAGEPVGLKGLYQRLIAHRRALGGAGEATDVRFDEDERWISYRRGEHLVAASFADQDVAVPAPGATEVLLATHDARLDAEALILPPMSGALLQ